MSALIYKCNKLLMPELRCKCNYLLMQASPLDSFSRHVLKITFLCKGYTKMLPT